MLMVIVLIGRKMNPELIILYVNPLKMFKSICPDNRSQIHPLKVYIDFISLFKSVYRALIFIGFNLHKRASPLLLYINSNNIVECNFPIRLYLLRGMGICYSYFVFYTI